MFNYRKFVSSASIVLAVTLLNGCMYSTYITESGTRVTPEMIAQMQQRPPEDVLPYAARDVSYRAYAVWSDEFVARRDVWRQSQGIPLQHESARAVVAGWATEDAPAVATVHFQDIARTDKKSFIYLPGMVIGAMTAYLIPGYIKQDSFSEMQLELPDGSLVKHEARVTRKQAVSLLPLGLGDHTGEMGAYMAVDYAAVIAHEEWLRKAAQQEKARLAAVNREDVAALTAALRDPDIVLLRVQLKAELAALLIQRPDRLDHYRTLTAEFPDFIDFIPGHEQLFFVGPKNLRVIDIWQKVKQREDSEVLVASIKASRQPYRVFDSEETAWLRKQGIPNPLIVAMIEVSAPTAPAASLNTVAAADPAANQSPGAAGECAKALAARKACERIPGDPFGIAIKVCVGQVKKKFGGMNCPLL